jgi:hypothetical protein
MPPPCAACAAPAAPLACARCRCAFYCGAACQRAAWGAHKGVCVAGAAAALPALAMWKTPRCCSTCGADGVLAGCLGCKCAAYCNEQCQRAAWGAHRDACRAAAATKVTDAQEQSHCSQCACAVPLLRRKLCGRCRTESYCGEACARAHWTGGHRGACAAAGAALVAYTRARADAGDSTNFFNLGVYYLKGIGIAPDATAAAEWFKRGAEAGDVAAQFNLGISYQKGEIVAADAAAAVMWFTRAANAGHADAMNSLAACYYEGKGVAVDFAKSIALFTRAAEAGNAIAQYNLGMRFLEGSGGVARDDAKAREWLARAAAGGDTDAAEKLAALDAAAPP